MKRLGYRHTVYACYIGYVTQAIVNNFAPLLFLTFMNEFGVSLEKISLLITLNFGMQIIVDWIAGKYADKWGYRFSILLSHICSALGLAGLAILPSLLPDPFIGLLVAVMIYAVGGGLLEVLITPIVEACPLEDKSGNVALLHSFYNWGVMAVMLLSTAFFVLFGTRNWRILALLWAVVPALNTVYFANVPIGSLIEEGETGLTIVQLLKNKVFWVLAVIMLCAGACELGIAQWASTFAEAALGVSKTIGDLAGPTAFTLLMGIARVLYGINAKRMKIEKYMLGCGVLCLISYLIASLSRSPVFGLIGCALCGLSVGVLWPGAFSLSADAIRNGGTAMFALMALFGDLGGGGGPGFVGIMAEAFGGNLKTGILFGSAFPILLIISLLLLDKLRKKEV